MCCIKYVILARVKTLGGKVRGDGKFRTVYVWSRETNPAPFLHIS